MDPHSPPKSNVPPCSEGLSELGRAAVAYARAGFNAHPLERGGKRPLLRGWQKRASSDPRIVAGLWEGKPNANIGLRTGDRLAVIDVDPRHGGEINPAWPATRTVRTRSGGWHLYYRVEGEVRNSAGKLAEGVDVRGDGGYVVGPPSPGWEWDNDLPIASISASVLRGEDGSRRRPGQATRRPRAKGKLPFALGERITAGRRNDYFASLAGWLWSRGVDEGALEEILLGYNREYGDPPLKDNEVRRIARSIARYER
jgi:hypothetical protein